MSKCLQMFSRLLIVLGFMMVARGLLAVPYAQPPVPQDNPLTAAKIRLGKMLFFDPVLSADGSISCNSCHNVFGSGTDNRAVSMGVQGKLGGRSSPTVWNAAFLSVLFWDGRAGSLEEQALGPITNPIEMGTDSIETVVNRLKQIPDYEKMFKEAFGSQGISPKTIGQAIASFERTLITEKSPYDRFQAGDSGALTADAKKGFELFQSVGCISCHGGPHFAGPPIPMGTGFFQKFPVVPGTSFDQKYGFSQDPGRMSVTGKAEDKNMWRVPTLRNIAITAPYFHNGSVPTLQEAIRVMAKVQLHRDLSDDEVQKIGSFLEALTGEFPAITAPRLPQPHGYSFYMPQAFSKNSAQPVKKAG